MTHIEQAIKEAVEKGEYRPQKISLIHETENYRVDGKSNFVSKCNATPFLDPLFWQALGKARGWEVMTSDTCRHCSRHYPIGQQPEAVLQWKVILHRFIDHLAEGKDAESFFADL